ncbi:hypothetical protein GcC1_c11123o5 [Golovinomyces cichoracearum]|uniref:Uncharacterized protein n=1 Tax=Golovinomyces cichoracearum TaxID=62708 RepID=A0A420J820_9PEZI|nr:hypothetical protein GcC1_c11123o5 [Golovinomyces cichoracearum]
MSIALTQVLLRSLGLSVGFVTVASTSLSDENNYCKLSVQNPLTTN